MALKVQALVYAGEGASPLSAEAIVCQLRKVLDVSIEVKKVSAADLVHQSWEQHTVVLAMGGGVCSQWEQSLGEAGMRKIHNYVRGGGKYLGFCAGAYFGARESYFQVGRHAPIEKRRRYGFLEGRAVGPLVDHEEYLSPEAAKALPVCFQGLKGKVYYQGGCYFDVKESKCEVVGIYEDSQRPAAVLCRVGTGAAFLCGPHPEFEWGKVKCPLVDELGPQEEFRQKIWELIKIKLSLAAPPKPRSWIDMIYEWVRGLWEKLKKYFNSQKVAKKLP